MSMFRFASLCCLVFGILTAVTGCLTNSKLRGIAVQLDRVEASTGAAGPELALTVRYMNENLVAIAAAGSEHRIQLGGVSLDRIVSEQAIGLPRMADATEVIRVPLNARQVTQLRQLQSQGSVPYQMETKIIVEVADDDMKSETSGSGTVDLSQLGL